MGHSLAALSRESAQRRFAPLRQKLSGLGIKCETELSAIETRIKLGPCVDRGGDILPFGSSTRHLTVLISGVACLYERLQNGSRQIFAFQYPGDFCDLSRHVLSGDATETAVAAVTDCSTGMIEHAVLDQLIVQFPSLGLALWRSSLLEAGALRERLLGVGRQTALQRVAHLLCEQLVRLKTVGINDALVPVSQIDLADAVGLSVVHINRIFRELQDRGLLCKSGRWMKVVDPERLALLAGFDSSYLSMPRTLAAWKVSV